MLFKRDGNLVGSYTKMKTFKELKSSLRKVSCQVSLLQKNFEDLTTKYRTLGLDDFKGTVLFESIYKCMVGIG